MQKTILFLILCFPLLVHAGIYKGFDKQGNVAYSDTPFNNAKKISLPALSIMDAPKTSENQQKTVAKEEANPSSIVNYKQLTISSPENQQTIWNNNQLAVTLALTPPLNTKAGDYIQLRMDGKIIVNKSTKLILQIGYIDRGEHQLQAMVRNKKRKVLKLSRVITVYIKHTIIHRTRP